ncbi:hypothetical protein VP01_5868g1, partial [Puccinia sorghi]
MPSSNKPAQFQGLEHVIQASADWMSHRHPPETTYPPVPNNAPGEIMALSPFRSNSIICRGPATAYSLASEDLTRSSTQFNPGPDSTEPAIPTPNRHEFCPELKAYLRANIRMILLLEDLECYGRQMTQKLHSSKSPFALIKVNDCHPQQKINTQGLEFHSKHLPPNYANNPEITSQLDSLIASI